MKYLSKSMNFVQNTFICLCFKWFMDLFSLFFFIAVKRNKKQTKSKQIGKKCHFSCCIFLYVYRLSLEGFLFRTAANTIKCRFLVNFVLEYALHFSIVCACVNVYLINCCLNRILLPPIDLIDLHLIDHLPTDYHLHLNPS